MSNTHTTTIRHESDGERPGTSHAMDLAELRAFVDACEAAGMPMTTKPRFSVRRGERGNTMSSVQSTCDVADLVGHVEPYDHTEVRRDDEGPGFVDEGGWRNVEGDEVVAQAPIQGELFDTLGGLRVEDVGTGVTAPIGGKLIVPSPRPVRDNPQA